MFTRCSHVLSARHTLLPRAAALAMLGLPCAAQAAQAVPNAAQAMLTLPYAAQATLGLFGLDGGGEACRAGLPRRARRDGRQGQAARAGGRPGPRAPCAVQQSCCDGCSLQGVRAWCSGVEWRAPATDA